MMQAPVLRFLIFDWLKLDLSQQKLAHLNQSLVEQFLLLCEQLAKAALAPSYQRLDRCAPELLDGRVQTPAELNDALQALAQAGLFGTRAALAEGGTALPGPVCAAVAALLSRYNAPVFDYVRQTQATASLIRQFGSSEQKRRYLPLFASGDYFGALCLSETQAGTSLGDVHTSASPAAGRRFFIKGRKAWVSGAEHHLARNIVFLVLARIEGAAPGTRGLSLFVVPRLRESDGQLVDNGVVPIGLNALAGLRTVVNADLSFGASTPCIAERLGDQGSDLAITQLQSTLNERCLAAGIAALGTAAHAVASAQAYTLQRRQGRALAQTDSRSEQIAIAHHPQIRLKLLRARALTDGALLLVLHIAHRADAADDGNASAKVELALLAPIAKCWPGRMATEVTELAAQLCGAAGLTDAIDLAALQRDASAIRWLEGGEDTHALDFMTRQVIADDGAALVQLLNAIAQTAQRAALSARYRTMAATALELGAELAKIALMLGEQLRSGAVEQALCQSSRFMDALGTIVVAWLSLDVALASVGSEYEQRFFENCRYLHEFELESVRADLVILGLRDLSWILADRHYANH